MVTAEQEGHWRSVQTHAGTWTHEETWHFTDAPDGRTTVRITGWHLRPKAAGTSTALQSALNGLAADALNRLAERVAERA
ncbi:hypothetical protein [Cellulomonas fengjieae]|uniref:Coenzyme Q-binding protein COQ10 START domain-containing protein n=1 Tax=Cellulomonas fengjieae TaxID=2819978 RepID=A0ABS3SMY8_9CELL|nr:hypothetical protein [Cellulomonas fengjieae]MBO3086316.1 hypothetical protein [Cellulomonas fengjieae]QVI65645.1 hypothetical protein KG102_16375 [Cellulomonas fengjieae]